MTKSRNSNLALEDCCNNVLSESVKVKLIKSLNKVLIMLNRKILLIAALIAFVMPSTAALAETKIGVYNNKQILESLPKLKKEFKKLDAEFAPKQKQIKDLQAKLVALQEDIKKNGPVLSEEQRQAKQLEFQSLRRELKLLGTDTQEAYNSRANQLVRETQNLIVQEVGKIAKEEQFDLILTGGYLYSSPKVDITQKVLKRLSNK